MNRENIEELKKLLNDISVGRSKYTEGQKVKILRILRGDI